MVCSKHHEDDAQILKQVKELASVGVTVDQLGVPEDFAVPLPAAVWYLGWRTGRGERKGDFVLRCEKE
jgi:hypothetical protein